MRIERFYYRREKNSNQEGTNKSHAHDKEDR